VFITVSPLVAQDYSFRQYNALDGLPQSETGFIFQDSRGYIWITTRNGLSRYDGIDFVNYYRKDGLPSNSIKTIIETPDSIIYVVSSEGLSEYTGRNFRFYPRSAKDDKFQFDLSPSVTYKDGYIYLINYSIDGRTKIIRFRNGVYSDFSGRYFALDTLDKNNVLYNSNDGGFLITDRKGNLWEWKDDLLKKIKDGAFASFITYRNHLLLDGSNNEYEYKNGRIEEMTLINNIGEPAVRISNYGMERTIDFFDGHYLNDIVPSFDPSFAYIDKEGNLWLTSETNIHRLLSTAFTSFSYDEIGLKNIWAMAPDKNGHIWFGSLFNNLVEYDGKTFRERNEYKSFLKGDMSFYKGSRLMKNGELWLSTDRGVIIWDGAKFSRLGGLPDRIQICYIYEDPEENLKMLGTNQGLYIMKKAKTEILPEFTDRGLGVIEGVIKDDSGFYWLSGHHGLLKYDRGNISQVKDTILPGGFTYTLEKDKHGGIWITSEEGLFYKAKNSKSFKQGLPAEFNRPANSIMIMNDSDLIVGRVSDICIVNLNRFYKNEKRYFRQYDNTDGFPGSDCLDNGIVKDQKGNTWILTSDKVVILDPRKLRKNIMAPKLNITGFYYQTDSLTWAPVYKNGLFYKIPDLIHLDRFQNKVQITFTGISTTNPEKVTYRYFLSGYDSKWSLPTSKRFVAYEKLPPGSYSFELLASNADGVENSEPLVMNFDVIPEFWQTRVFQIFSILLILIVTISVTLLIMRRRHQIRIEKEKLHNELFKLQMNSVLSQFDPHFTFNVISSVGSLIIKGEKETAYAYITKLSALLRSVLNEGTMLVKSLSEEVSFVRKYCELQKLRFKDRFNFNISIDSNVNLQREIPKMTIQTFVENSIKHGFEKNIEDGHVDIIITKTAEAIEILIKDNGVGRMAASRKGTDGTGHGLKIISGLFDIMNSGKTNPATISITDMVKNGQPSGTEVIIRIPDDYNYNLMTKDNN
jgi:hypothetical protein